MTARIIIIEPNGVRRTMPLTERGLSIGRGTNSDININYPETSRSHAYISYDAGRYYVVDLESGNGTYLGQQRLIPNEPALWTPGTPVKIGQVFINLEQDAGRSRAQQFQHPERRGRDETDETILGWVPPQEEPEKTGRNWIWPALLFVLASLCVCSALGVAAYFLMTGG